MKKYFKIIEEDSTHYYNVLDEFVTEIIETADEYVVSASDVDQRWLRENAEEIDQSEFDKKANDTSEFARVGTHPPCPPGGCV